MILHVFAYFLLWVAVDQGREEKVKLFSNDWWIVLGLMIIAGLILTHS